MSGLEYISQAGSELMDGRETRRPRVHAVAWVMAGIAALTLSLSLLRIPVQVTDSLLPLLDAQAQPTVGAIFVAHLSQRGYFRPLRLAQVKLLFDASGGEYFRTFRGFHVGLVLAVFAAFTVVVAPRRRTDLGPFAFGLLVLMGLPAFAWTVLEAYPINHFLEVTLACLLACALAQGRPRWWADAAACLLFAATALTLESGLLVWVVFVAAWAVGLRGVSGRGVVALTVLLGAYLIARLVVFDVGTPGLDERSSGFWLERLDPDELTRRFGAWPYAYYAYNVASSLLSVLASEPKDGVWWIPAALMRDGAVNRGTLVNVASSVLTSGFIAWWGLRTWKAWQGGAPGRDARIGVVALCLLGANAIFSYGYTKDVIMSAGAAFYAVLAVFAARELRAAATRDGGRAAVVAAVLVATLLVPVWMVRVARLHHEMHKIALIDRREWSEVDAWLVRQESVPDTAEGRALVQALRDDALRRTESQRLWLAPAFLERLVAP
jgi:hypothetical protein